MKLHRNWTMSLPLVLALSAGMSGFCADPLESAGKKKENVPPPPGERRPGPPPRGRNPHAVFFSKLTQEERAEIDKLARANDHAGLRQKMRELFLKYRPPEAKKVDELSEKYLAARTDAEKAAVKAELEKAVRIQFEKRLEFTRNNIAATEEQLARAKNDLERLKTFYQNSLKDSEKIIRERVEQMCLPKEQRKKPPRGGKPMEPPGGLPGGPPQPSAGE
ncbi:MAG: hypothetical protein BWY31_02748 [Lentisphaerae bacterium ADurb.Bin242]|nr:MAG: hypothetical protein BWY31_02748 [Lentisphaerae bacterium ADurb.Bin242]